MPDQLYLSLWIRGFEEATMLRHFRQLLDTFPFSKLRTAVALRVYAIEEVEPPLFERFYPEHPGTAELVETAAEFSNPDCAFHIEGWWELWQYEADDWKLAPARVTLICAGPEFDNDIGDNLRIEVGVDAHFLPQPEFPESARLIQSNIQGLLRLVHEVSEALPVERKSLWSESGENFAERLETTLSEEF